MPKVCQNPMFFDRLGLVSSEEHIPQVNENTEKAKWLLVAWSRRSRAQGRRLKPGKDAPTPSNAQQQTSVPVTISGLLGRLGQLHRYVYLPGCRDEVARTRVDLFTAILIHSNMANGSGPNHCSKFVVVSLPLSVAPRIFCCSR